MAPRKRDVRLAVLLLLVICFSLASLTLWKVWSSRERALSEVNGHSLNLTQALDTYAEGVIRQSSMLLLGIGERLEVDGDGPRQLERLRSLVQEQDNLLTQLHGITIYDADGGWLMSSNGPVPAGANSADREFFIHHRDSPSREVFIGPPIQSRSTQEWVITVSRRFERTPGQFAGVIAVTLGVENFL
ncbi:PDC sensor domain-containing protein, partial [Pseudomonas aegrilactucae]|nr:diguanylate cyclase [Pseudomonas aegrilactucae]